VYTRAVGEDNPELVAAKSMGLPTIEGAEMLGRLYELFDQRVSVTGTHGKTSTSAMLSSILVACGKDPTVLIGGKSPDIDGHARLGKTSLFVAEACEAYASFHHLRSSLALITNVDADHLDFYHSHDGVKDAFVKFIGQVDADGIVLACADDPHLQSLKARVDRKWLTFGFAEDADFRVTHVRQIDDGEAFTLSSRDWSVETLLPMFGRHFVSNAAGAIAAAILLGCDPDRAARALRGFRGVGRRMELKGRFGGVTVVDDYAHHPTEIDATLAAAREQYSGRITVVFQPHLFSRTSDHLTSFARALLASDRLVLTNVYAAREDPEAGLQADILFKEVAKLGHKDAHYVPDLAKVAAWLVDRMQPGDVVMTIGAGNVFEAGEHLLDLLRAHPARSSR
ncbi:MAG: UDP-N-acetylmuramate--L-alanine ligase, partial [Armatimonadota bacterium]